MKQKLFKNNVRSVAFRLWYFTQALILGSAGLITVFNPSTVHASQITSRSITMSSSKVSQTSTTFNVSFKPATVTGTGADDIKGIVVELCQDSPLVGNACTTTNGVTSSPTSGTIAVAHTGATGTPVNFTVDATNSTATGRLIITSASGLDIINASNPITFSFTATNPSALGTFYARVLTYNTVAGAQAYVSATPGTHLDDGGIALSTARQLTVNARVQEQLEFCVAAITGVTSNGTTPANCAAFPATTLVDLGVVDSTISVGSPVSTNGGNNTDGGIEIRTNANLGAVISYFAEQDTSSGKLKVPGATCSGTSTTDQCFNSAGATQVAFASEGFGMTISNVYQPTGSTTTNLTRDTDYDGNGAPTGTCTAATVDSPNCWAWVDSGTNNPLAEPIATSSTVMDYEYLRLRFAARAAATTPTGSYQVTSTYIASSVF